MMNEDGYDDYTHPLDGDVAIRSKDGSSSGNQQQTKTKKKKNKNRLQSSDDDADANINNGAPPTRSPTQRNEQLLEQNLQKLLQTNSTSASSNVSNSGWNNNNNNNNNNSNRFQKLDEVNIDKVVKAVPSRPNEHQLAALSSSAAATACGGAVVVSNAHAPAAPKHRRSVAQHFDIALVLDFEATCDENTPDYPHEIIEFPVVAIDAHCRTCANYSTSMATNKAILGEFQSYVRPLRNPTLTPFCTELTGITQEQVDAAPTLPEVIARFQVWLKDLVKSYAAKNNGKNSKSNTNNNHDDDDDAENENAADESTADNNHVRVVFATDGPWDFRKFMFELSVCRDGTYFPSMFFSFLNVRQEFATYFKCKPLNLGQTLGRLGMRFEGQPHSGIDDSRNIARIVKVLLDRGHRFSNPCKIGNSGKEGKILEESLFRVRYQLKQQQQQQSINNGNKKSTAPSSSKAQLAKNAADEQKAAALLGVTTTTTGTAVVPTKKTPPPPPLDRCLMKMIELEGIRVVNDVFEKFS